VIAALTLENLSIARGERVLFSDLSLALEAGEAAALTGANGAGKTSLLRAIAGLLRPRAGRIGFGDLDPDEARREGLHLVGHLDGLKGGRTARQELAFQTGWCGADDAGLAEAVGALHLAPLLDLEVRKLSAGQRRRLALARLIAAPRALWLLDEPLAPLDARWREAFGGLMQAHLNRGGLILAAVHDPLPILARPFELGAAR